MMRPQIPERIRKCSQSSAFHVNFFVDCRMETLFLDKTQNSGLQDTKLESYPCRSSFIKLGAWTSSLIFSFRVVLPTFRVCTCSLDHITIIIICIIIFPQIHSICTFQTNLSLFIKSSFMNLWFSGHFSFKIRKRYLYFIIRVHFHFYRKWWCSKTIPE